MANSRSTLLLPPRRPGNASEAAEGGGAGGTGTFKRDEGKMQSESCEWLGTGTSVSQK